MTKKALEKIIQEVVRREVQKEVNKLFIKENKSSLKSLAPKKVVKKKSVRKEKVQYTDNKALNDVLNETVGLNDKSQEMDEYPTMGGGVFDSSRASELLGYGESTFGDDETKRNMNAAQTLREKGVSTEQVPESLVNALTRDYSDLMKHDKFKGKK